MVKELRLEEGEFEQDVSIDPDALDVEWLQQPRLMKKYGSLLAYYQLLMDQAKEAYEVELAILDKKIRDDPGAFRISKLTETVIGNTIKLQPEYREAYKKYLDAKYEYTMLKEAGVKAIDHKRAALENLVKLHGQQYFAGPSVPRDLSREAQSRHKQAQVNRKVGVHRRSKVKGGKAT